MRQHVSTNHGHLQAIQYHKSGNTAISLKYVLNILNIKTHAEFTHQQMHFYQFKEHIKIYIKIHINIARICFGLRPSSGILH